jgi:hypothetical protein
MIIHGVIFVCFSLLLLSVDPKSHVIETQKRPRYTVSEREDRHRLRDKARALLKEEKFDELEKLSED